MSDRPRNKPHLPVFGMKYCNLNKLPYSRDGDCPRCADAKEAAFMRNDEIQHRIKGGISEDERFLWVYYATDCTKKEAVQFARREFDMMEEELPTSSFRKVWMRVELADDDNDLDDFEVRFHPSKKGAKDAMPVWEAKL